MNLFKTIEIVFLFLAGTIFLHILVCQLAPNKFMFKGLLLGILGTFLLAILFFNVLAIYLYFTSWLFYLMAFINLLNSATLKMVERLYNEPKRVLSSEDFKTVFNEEDGFKTRLNSMELNGFITRNNQSIFLPPKSQFLLAIILLLRKILSIDQVG